MHVTEIPNHTVKNRCFDMCLPISINSSVTEQYEMSEVCLH